MSAFILFYCFRSVEPITFSTSADTESSQCCGMKRVWLVRLMLGQQGVVAYILPIEAFVTGIENLDWQKSPLIT